MAKNRTPITEADIERVRNARRLVYDAIGELCQSKMAIYLGRQINELRSIEDALWQLTTITKGEHE